MVDFQIIHQDIASLARCGLLTTGHGEVETPCFMPVGSDGAVKGMMPIQLFQTDATIILANTYHLLLRPGVKTIEKVGGLHRFMAWDKPILTDSGGYQVFSLSSPRPSKTGAGSLTKVDDDGVEFASYVDGAKVYLSPEITIETQNRLGADIITCLDQCTTFPIEPSELKKAVERTIRWAKLCKQAHTNAKQLLFGIVQGGINLELRAYCANELVELDFDGYAIGGLSVGEGHDNMIKTVSHTTQLLPRHKPRYLMGVGTPRDIIAAVKAGVDMFDCVLPTRNGRNAFAFTDAGPLRLRNSNYINDPEPIEAGCDCYCCKNFSRAALRHFFNCGEMLGPILTSLHNLYFFQKLMANIKQAIKNDDFDKWANEQLKRYKSNYNT